MQTIDEVMAEIHAAMAAANEPGRHPESDAAEARIAETLAYLDTFDTEMVRLEQELNQKLNQMRIRWG